MAAPLEERVNPWNLLVGYVLAGGNVLMLLLMLVNGRFHAPFALSACATLVAGLAIIAGEQGHPARRWLWFVSVAAAGTRLLLFPIHWPW